MKRGLKKFIKSVLEDGKFEGTRYFWLDDTYALVFGYEGDSLNGKVAYNQDDLQCDYDWDWFMPFNSDNEVIDTELTHCDEDTTADDLAKGFTEYYKDVKKYGICRY